MNLLLDKVKRVLTARLGALVGGIVFDLDKTMRAMALRPFELHLELTNLCNANCIFCPYQFQQRPKQFMTDAVFAKAVADFVACGGGSVGLTPIVGDALIDPKMLERTRHLRSLPAIDRIFLTTNAILLDRFGIAEVLTSGINSITISTSGFDAPSYQRIYRSSNYPRMRQNVQALVEENARLGNPVHITIGIRTDRPLSSVMQDPDFQPILAHKPAIDFTWAFTSAGGRITRELLPPGMRLRTAPPKTEPCVNLYNGPVVLPDGMVLGCSCVAAMDALSDLTIGNVMEQPLLDIYVGQLLAGLREQFRPGGQLNPTCRDCEMYRNLDLYRRGEGRTRARLNERRSHGQIVRRTDPPRDIFSGG